LFVKEEKILEILETGNQIGGRRGFFEKKKRKTFKDILKLFHPLRFCQPNIHLDEKSHYLSTSQNLDFYFKKYET